MSKGALLSLFYSSEHHHWSDLKAWNELGKTWDRGQQPPGSLLPEQDPAGHK